MLFLARTSFVHPPTHNPLLNTCSFSILETKTFPYLPTPRLLKVAGVGGRQEDAVGGGAPLLRDPGSPQRRQVGRAGHAVESEGGDGKRGGPVGGERSRFSFSHLFSFRMHDHNHNHLQRGASDHSQGFEDENLGSYPGLLGQ